VPNRPMTHDLFKSFAHVFEFTVTEIIISDLKEGVFFAKIMCKKGTESLEVDARPSDAIAIGIRFNAPIFTYERILSEAGIVLTDEEEASGETTQVTQPIKRSDSVKPKSFMDKLKDMSIDKLNEMLDKAINDEDYERAAKIRDELNRRN
jgi:uncharacterized protein